MTWRAHGRVVHGKRMEESCMERARKSRAWEVVCPHGLVLDFALCVLLVITIIYAIIPNKKMKAVRAARAAMATLTADLDAAVRHAEEGLAKVKAEAAESTTRLVERGEAAKASGERFGASGRACHARRRPAGELEPRESRRGASCRARRLDDAARRRHGLAAEIRDR